MITLITGAPGSGKTLYCIDKILRPVLGTTVSGTDDEGNAAVYDRRIYTNINGLLLDHELIDRDWLENIHDRKTTGAFVVFDEVQRVWPNRPNGSKKPPSVEYLETHRHDGIDIVLLTQSPQLLDPAVRALVGRHLHMRRLGSMGAAVVYEWDACSNALNYKNAFTKTPYRYSRQVFKLYKSSRAHTKQTRRLPAAVYFGVAGLLAAAYMWPQLIGRITGQQDQAVQQAETKTASVPDAKPLAAASALPTAAGAAGEVHDQGPIHRELPAPIHAAAQRAALRQVDPASACARSCGLHQHEQQGLQVLHPARHAHGSAI